MSILIYVLLAFLAGIAVMYFLKQKDLADLPLLRAELNASQQQLSEYKSKSLTLQQNLSTTEKQLSTNTAKLEAKEEKLQEQQLQFKEMSGQFRNEFRILAGTILEEKSKKFAELNEVHMKTLLDPLQANLKDFKQKVEDTYDRESKERFSLGNEVKKLFELNKQLGEEASNLTQALKYNNKVQGNWGEMILESLLEHSGLTRDREYFIQEFLRDESGIIIKDESGRGLQPDVVIMYPDQRKVIIDSKMSLLAYERYVAAGTNDEEALALKEHVRSIKQHIDGLSGKNYPRYAGSALDHVILFMPVEPAFLIAVKEDTNLWKYAYERRVLLVSPTNLLAVLKIIADLWKVEQQNKHAIEIAEKAGSLYDKFVLFVESMDDIGKHLEKASDAHATAFKRLSKGTNNLVRQSENLKSMGVKTNKQLPTQLLGEESQESITN